jgi:sodium/bile acid cotransporter 3/5
MLQLSFSIAMMVLSSGGEHLLALGLFVTGCCPGGGASNYWTILLGGNANLSVTMTFVSTVGAMGEYFI